ncbi:hypothetical protein M3O96_19930 [Aquiflexum sp. TKW24L]|uniref:hypothetical protein n=1 Tax=Aquiflexum sp. TKW24L TaxID=2942212 RepID=UPI0020BE4972|nr:hypothetical protein [Aquiflexum sp. TKW24L]MCL6261379.1 hypothetical protein [Aquiflexum sp. TKW24L]
MKFKLSLNLILCFLFSVNSFGQEPDSTAKEEKEAVYDFLIINGRYQNTFTFLGRDFGQTIPFGALDIMYFFNSGLYFNISSFKFLQDEIPFQYGATIGYTTEFSQKTDFNISYSQFFVGQSSGVSGIENMGYLQTTFGLDWGIMYSTVQPQFLFNEKNDYFIGSHHSRYFEIDQKLFNILTLSFEPKFSILAGTSRFYQIGYDGQMENALLDETEKFQLLSTEFSLPIKLAKGSWEVEFQPRYVIPINLPEYDFSTERFVWGFQLSYAIPVKKDKP